MIVKLTPRSSQPARDLHGIVHAPYADLTLEYLTYATACCRQLEHWTPDETALVTCLGCIGRSAR